jgi:hypothetical protein
MNQSHKLLSPLDLECELTTTEKQNERLRRQLLKCKEQRDRNLNMKAGPKRIKLDMIKKLNDEIEEVK